MNKRLEENIIELDSDQIPDLNPIEQLLERDAFACLRGLISPAQVAAVVQTMKQSFDPQQDRKMRPDESHLMRRNYQRMILGGTRAGQVIRPRFLRTFYNPLTEPDLYGMHDLFRTMIRVRNRLYGLAPGFAETDPEDGLFSVPRIHQYPRGGGFMAPHRDDVLSGVARRFNLRNYYQVILLMSRKGEDYSEGGGYLVQDGERVFFESVYQPGDIVIYNGQTEHGVEEVDPLEPLVLDRLEGRLAAFVSLFELRDQGSENQR